MKTRDKATENAKRRWNRTAVFYDLMMALIERLRLSKYRALLWSRVESSRVLEIGVGTGKNFPYYPPDAEIDAVDFSEKMLERAKDRAKKQKVRVHLQQMDVQNLDFADNAFDTVAATLVFCSIPDPVRGIKEVERVCKPGGKVVLLENNFSSIPILGWFVKLINPIALWMIGADFNRHPEENVAKSGLKVERVTNLGRGLWKLIEARKKPNSSEKSSRI
ncbi:MAG: methyltransferase domain-containing protein [Dehalococcoidia bacterium]|nr:methyltransferase domain-containing protein [Dehalococcoidia bacterium]